MVEAAALALPLLALVMLGVYTGRVSAADADVESAAAEAARAASLRATAAGAERAARATAQENIDDSGVACGSLQVDVDTSAFAPGGSVSVTVSCRVSNSDLLLVAPGDRTLHATGIEVVDTLRGVGP